MVVVTVTTATVVTEAVLVIKKILVEVNAEKT